MSEGKVIWWNCDQGYGYVKAEGEDVLVHHAAMLDDITDLRVGEIVELDVVAGTCGSVGANIRRAAA